MLLGNLFRDQLDRYGELETIADRWAAHRQSRASCQRRAWCSNADDPLVADLGRDAHRRRSYFGVDDDSLALPELQHASDSKHCRRCGHAYTYSAVYLAHLGHYHCPNCGQERPEPTVVGHRRRAHGIKQRRLHARRRRGAIELPLPGLYNVYNALGAAALTLSLGRRARRHRRRPARPSRPPSAAPRRSISAARRRILLVKNPAGANEVLRTLALEGGELDLLGVLNDRTADGRDVSWVWDADWELLVGSVRRITCVRHARRRARAADEVRGAGDRAHPRRRRRSRRRSTRRSPTATARSTSIPTYTALLELRELLTRRGQAEAYWR